MITDGRNNRIRRARVDTSLQRRVRHYLYGGGYKTLRQIYNAIHSTIPVERAKATYRRQGIDTVRVDPNHQVEKGRKRAIYRALLQMNYDGYTAFGKGSDWSRQVRLTKAGRVLTHNEMRREVKTSARSGSIERT